MTIKTICLQLMANVKGETDAYARGYRDALRDVVATVSTGPTADARKAADASKAKYQP